MRFRFALPILVATALVMPFAALADGWNHYDNPRFAYSIDIPPGFSAVEEAANSDGGVSRSADGAAELLVWGGHLVIGDFTSDIADRIRSDTSAGWRISYDHRTATKASWSGSKGDRIFYARAVSTCGDSSIHFRLEYDRADLERYDDIVGRLVRSLKGTC